MNTAVTGQTGALDSLRSANETFAGKALLAICASLFVALCAHLSVPLPFTPVPLTLSDLAVLLVGLTLGPSTAFAALVLYLAEGASGLPVFSPSGPGGMLQLLGPTGGFLLSYPLAAALAGAVQRMVARMSVPRFGSALAGAVCASTLLMVCGVVWLGTFAHLAPMVALSKGALPFLPGRLIKVCAAAGISTASGSFRRS